MMNVRFLKVTFYAALVLLVETVLFHLLMYIHDFFAATSVISYAVLGIGLGAFAASKIRLKESTLFFVCALGTSASLYIVSYVLVNYPALWAIAAGTALSVFFPIIFIAVLFREAPGGKVYLYDMAGAFLGVVATVVMYEFLDSESIILILVSGIPLVGLIDILGSKDTKTVIKVAGSVIALPVVALGFVLLSFHIVDDTFNIYRIFNRETELVPPKVFVTNEPEHLVKSYDSLIERLDVLDKSNGKKYLVSYNGYANDHFKPDGQKTYEWYKERGRTWPSGDQRVFYGYTEDPSIYIIGAAARGVTETVKKLTPAKNIVPVEIDPSIVKIMAKDFYNESGKAYKGLKPIVGNAISLLKSLDKKFDIITLINTHAARTIGYRTGPDHLQTKENYDLYLDHLTDDGFLLFEERVYNRSGDLGFYRMLNTMWHTLRERGVADPSKHFFIWEWDASRNYPRIDKRYDDEKNRYRRAETLYYGMIVTKSPIEGRLLDRTLEWYRDGVSICRVAYLKDVLEWGEVADVFKMIETGDFSTLEEEGFDTRIVTNDIPFPSLSTISIPEIDSLINSSSFLFILLTTLFVIGTYKGVNKRHATHLCTFNILIGLGYFFIEIMLLQIYQNIFVSPSWSLVLVLGFLLLSSGIGGVYAAKLKPWQVTALLIPTGILAIYTPELLITSGLPAIITKIASVIMICATGFLMGLYFPRGLELAAKWKIAHKIPHLFAINSVAGSFAVILALYSGVKFGYQATVIIAVICYCLAGLLVSGKVQTDV